MTATGIVVGYDGSSDADQAVAWAAREAQARVLQADGLPRAGTSRIRLSLPVPQSLAMPRSAADRKRLPAAFGSPVTSSTLT